MSRVVRGLKWARVAQRPQGLPIGRPRGAKLEGVRYERRVAKALALAGLKFSHGKWWEFEDWAGRGVCQTDFVGKVGDSAVVLEVKYSWTQEAWWQLDQLYIPVLRMALACPVVGVQVCKMLISCAEGVVTRDLCEAIALAQSGVSPVTMHWAELGPLRAPSVPEGRNGHQFGT